MSEDYSAITSGYNNVSVKMKAEKCLKCEAWNRAAIESGYASGMCEECFKRDCVAVDFIYDPKE